VSRHDEPTNDVPLSGGEIAGFMNWRAGRGGSAPKTYAMMRAIRKEAGDA
jgi:hypothetical protein